MKNEKKPKRVKYLVYLDDKLAFDLKSLKARRNRQKKNSNEYLTSVCDLINEACKQYVDKYRIRRPRRAKALVQTHTAESQSDQAPAACLSDKV